VLDRWQKLKAQGESSFPALQQAIDTVFDARIGDISGRGKLAADMREIWQMQPRFERRQGNSAAALLEQPRFRAGFDFLRLRGDAGEIDAELANWWEDFSLADDEGRRKLLEAVRPTGGAVRRARSSAPKAVDAADTVAVDASESSGPAEADAVRKRRRRRRKPAAAGAEGANDSVPLTNPTHDV
jgi:poly(A) polymerase